MRDANIAGQRIGGQFAREVDQLARRAAPIDHPVMDGGDPGGVIAAIFEPLQPVEQPVGHVRGAKNAYDAAHTASVFRKVREGVRFK